MTTLYRIGQEGLAPLQRSMLATEEMLETWIARDPSLIGLDLLVIGRQIVAYSNGRIDILGINREGSLVIVELKRDRSPREIVAQVLDYASWVVTLTTKQVYDLAMAKLSRPLSEAFQEKFGNPLPETLNGDHRMVIVASELDPQSRRIVQYLAEHHELNINTVFFNVFEEGGVQFLATEWLMDQEEVDDRSATKKKLPWSGAWYANVGEGPHRSWEDMRKYGFISAGRGRKYSAPLDRLAVGEPLYVYQKQAGYVGFGTVTSTSQLVRDFKVDGKPLLSQKLVQPELAHDSDDEEMAEYAVGVQWHKTVPLNEAKTFAGAFANQNVVCKLRHQATLDFLKQEFGPSVER